MICESCRGKTLVPQCRGIRAWRLRNSAPKRCPYGLPLKPFGGGVFRGPNACLHLLVVPTGGCCDQDFFCTEGGRRKDLKRGDCDGCERRTDTRAHETLPPHGG